MTYLEELRNMAEALFRDEYASATDKLIIRAILELEERLGRIAERLPNY